MTDKLTKCLACSGRGYHRCQCWPGDCICGYGDETCDECGGDGFLEPGDEQGCYYPDENPAPATNVRGNLSMQPGFGFDHCNELGTGHSSGFSDADLADERYEPSRATELNSEVGGFYCHGGLRFSPQVSTADGDDPLVKVRVENRREGTPASQAMGEVDAMRAELAAIRKSVRNAMGAIESNQVADKDVHGTLNGVLKRLDALVGAKELTQ